MSVRCLKICLLALTLAAVLAVAPASASSHREAPGTAGMPKVDGADWYAYMNYEPGHEANVVLIATYNGLQSPTGAPNYYTLDSDAEYRMHIDTTGNGSESTTFIFRVKQSLADLQVPVGGKNISVPVINLGQIGVPPGGTAALNVQETYTIQVVSGPLDGANTAAWATDADSGSTRFTKPVDNIGHKSIPDYHSYAQSFIHNVSIPGCNGAGRVFVGQRLDGFAVNLGEIFDLVNIANPLGSRDGQANTNAGKGVTAFVLELPASCLVAAGGTFGSWTTAALPRSRVLKDSPGFRDLYAKSGDFVQVSRLGAPLVNEVVIGLKDKNRFNNSKPKDDGQFADYVTNPSLAAILEILFGAAGVKAPTNFPRADVVAAFLTGVKGLNQLGGPSEELRLNTAIAPTPAAGQNDLGVIGGDNAGFPNGRRPGDDVIDIALRVEMGVLCVALPGVYCHPSDAPSGSLPFTDGVRNPVTTFDATFPYLKDPVAGSPNGAGGNGLPGN
jgi:hypothetical protein